MTDNESIVDVSAKSTKVKSASSEQISRRAKELHGLVEKGISGIDPEQLQWHLDNAIGEIGDSLSKFEADYDAELTRFEKLLSSRKSKVTKALGAGLNKVDFGQGKDTINIGIDDAQIYNALFSKVLFIVRQNKSSGASNLLDEIAGNIKEMLGTSTLTSEEEARMSQLAAEIRQLKMQKAEVKVVEVGAPPKQEIVVNVTQEVTGLTSEEAQKLVTEQRAETGGARPSDATNLKNAATIAELEANISRLNAEFEAAAERSNELYDAVKQNLATQAELDAAESDTNLAEEKLDQAVKALEKEEQAQKKAKIKATSDQRSANDIINERLETPPKKEDDSPPEPPKTPKYTRSGKAPKGEKVTHRGKQPPSESDADYVQGARERIKVLDDAYDQFLSMQSMWMSGIEQAVGDLLESVRTASEEMVLVITAEVQRSIGQKLKVIGRQIEESFGPNATSGINGIGVKLDAINTTLTEIKGGLIKQKYIQESKHIPKSEVDEFQIKSISEMISTSLNSTLAPLMGEVLGENSELNWQKWINLEGEVRKPVIDRIMGFNKGGVVPGYGDQDSVLAKLTPGEFVFNPRRLEGGTIDWEAVKARRDFALRIRNEPVEHLGIFTSDSPYDVIEAIGDQTSVMQTQEQMDAIRRSGGRWSAIHNHPTEYHGYPTVFPSQGDIHAMTGGLYLGATGAERFSIVSGDVLSSIVAPASWDIRQEQHRHDWLKKRYDAEWKDAEPLLNFSIHAYMRNKVLSERGVPESIRDIPLFDYPKDSPELQRAFYHTLIQHKLKGFYGSIFNPESLRFLSGGTLDEIDYKDLVTAGATKHAFKGTSSIFDDSAEAVFSKVYASIVEISKSPQSLGVLNLVSAQTGAYYTTIRELYKNLDSLDSIIAKKGADPNEYLYHLIQKKAGGSTRLFASAFDDFRDYIAGTNIDPSRFSPVQLFRGMRLNSASGVQRVLDLLSGNPIVDIAPHGFSVRPLTAASFAERNPVDVGDLSINGLILRRLAQHSENLSIGNDSEQEILNSPGFAYYPKSLSIATLPANIDEDDTNRFLLADVLRMPLARKLAGGTLDDLSFLTRSDFGKKSAALTRTYKPAFDFLEMYGDWDDRAQIMKGALKDPIDKIIAFDTMAPGLKSRGLFSKGSPIGAISYEAINAAQSSKMPVSKEAFGNDVGMYVSFLSALEQGKGIGPMLMGMAAAKLLNSPVGKALSHIELSALPRADTIKRYLSMGLVPIGQQKLVRDKTASVWGTVPMGINLGQFLSNPRTSQNVLDALPAGDFSGRGTKGMGLFQHLTEFDYNVYGDQGLVTVPMGTQVKKMPSFLASGGPLMPGQTAVVGEEGPEMLVPAGRGFHVIPNPMFKAMGGARFLAGGTADQTMDAHNVRWAPDYVKDFAEGIAFMTSEALVDSISAEVGPEYRSAAGGLLKSLKVSLHDIAKGDYTGEKQKSPNALEMLRLQGGKTAEVLGRTASSLRYFVTGMLIANHVVRLLTASSKVYNSAMNAAGSGWGYILDAILLPLTPLIAPLMGGLMMIGNFFRANAWAAWTAIIAGFTAAITIAGYSIWKMKSDIEKAAAAFERFTAAMEGREYVPPEVKKGYASRAAGWAKEKWENFRTPSGPSPIGGGGTTSQRPQDKTPWQSGWTSGEEPIEMGSGQAIIPRMRWYDPVRPTDVGPVRKNSTYGEQYPRSSGNWATTYDEDGNPIVNKLYKIKKDLKHYLLGGKVGETGLAVLHAGELVVPANVINNIPHFAEGGVMGAAGSFGDWFMGAASGFASMAAGGISGLLTNPAIQGIFTGLRVISATLGAVMAPIAMVGGGVAAAMAASNKGMGVLSRIIGKSGEAQMEVAGNVGRAQRNLLTLINIELLAVVGGVLALLAAVSELKGSGEVGFDVAKLAAGFVNGLLSKWGQFVDDLIKGAGRFVDDIIKALVGKESFLGKFIEKLIGKEGFIPALLEKLFGKESFLGKFIDELVKGSKSFVDDLLTKLLGKEGGFMAGIIEKLVGKEGGFIPKLIEKLIAGGGVVAGALSKAGEIGGGILGKAGEYLGKAGEFVGLGKGAPFYAKGIKPTIGYIVGELIGGAAAQYYGGQGADQGYTGGMVGFRPDLAQGSDTTFAAGSAELLMSFLPKLWPAISAFNLIGQYQYGKESAEGRLPEGMDYGKYKEYRINVAAEQLADWWETTSASIKAVFDGMATWWNDSWNTLSTSLGTVFGSIATGIMDAWNNAVAAISAFFTVDNLKSMIMSALPGVLGMGAGVVKASGDLVGGVKDILGFKNGGLTTAEGIAYLHANEAIIPLSSVSNGSTNSRSDSRTMQITNHNTFEIKRDDDFLLFQRFQQFMANEQRRYTL